MSSSWFEDWDQTEAQLADYDRTESSRRVSDAVARKSRRVGTYDTETDPFHHCQDTKCLKCFGQGRIPKSFVRGVYYGDVEEYHEFETVEQFVSFIESKSDLFYAHNGGKFDYHELRPYFNTDQPVMLINGRISKAHIGRCEFRDSLNIFPNTALSDFGVKHEIDYEKMELDRRTDPNIKAEISSYLRQDCVGLHQQVTRYRNDFGKNLTQAGASMKYWEKRHFGLDAPRQSLAQFKQCKPYYYGGRVQCFVQGSGVVDFSVADINSAYPKAMMGKHPISVNPIYSRRLPGDDEALRTCLIRLKGTAKGCFPWRDPESLDLYFPEDDLIGRKKRREYFITGWEFIAALEENALSNIEIKSVMSFSHLVSFEDYIQYHYQARLEADAKGDKAGKIFGKYFMNSLYGKFGADPSHYAEYVIATEDSLLTWEAKGYQVYQSWCAGKTLMQRLPRESDLLDMKSRWRFYNVATAASITGCVRAKLFQALCRSSSPLYCDTDSVAAQDTSAFEFGKKLGQWKDEGRFDRYSIAGKKTYAFHIKDRPLEYDPKMKESERSWKLASKGVNFGAMPDGPQKIEALSRGESVTFLPQVPTYSVSRPEPRFINRDIKSTAKDIRIAPLPVPKSVTALS